MLRLYNGADATGLWLIKDGKCAVFFARVCVCVLSFLSLAFDPELDIEFYRCTHSQTKTNFVFNLRCKQSCCLQELNIAHPKASGLLHRSAKVTQKCSIILCHICFIRLGWYSALGVQRIYWRGVRIFEISNDFRIEFAIRFDSH